MWKASVVVNVKLAPTAIVVAADGVSAYAITVASTSPTSTAGRLTLIDLATGQVERGSALPAASQLFLVGPTLYVLEPIAGKEGHVSGPWTLYRLRSGAKLARIGPLPLGLSANVDPVTASGSAVAGTADTWIGAGSDLVEINPIADAVLRRLPAGGFVTSLSVSPDGKLLYAAVNRLVTNPVADPAAAITERHAATGAVIATSGLRFAITGADLHAVAGAVWASYRTGMVGGATLLGAAGLRRIGGLAKQVGKDLSQGGPIIQGPSVAVFGNHAWLSSAVGIACLQATTGKFLGGARLPNTRNGSPLWQPLAQTATAVYMTQPVNVNGSTDILRVRPPTGCLGQ